MLYHIYKTTSLLIAQSSIEAIHLTGVLVGRGGVGAITSLEAREASYIIAHLRPLVPTINPSSIFFVYTHFRVSLARYHHVCSQNTSKRPALSLLSKGVGFAQAERRSQLVGRGASLGPYRPAEEGSSQESSALPVDHHLELRHPRLPEYNAQY